MATFTDILDYSSGKTRVLVYTVNQSVVQLILRALEEAGKEVDYFLQNGDFKKEQNDFVIFETADCYSAAQFEPTIMFVSREMSSENPEKIAQNITPGGSLIYPEELEDVFDNHLNYFRKLPYSSAVTEKNETFFYASSEMGMLPVATSDGDLIKNLAGIQILCQQFGVLEAEFCEVLLNFR